MILSCTARLSIHWENNYVSKRSSAGNMDQNFTPASTPLCEPDYCSPPVWLRTALIRCVRAESLVVMVFIVFLHCVTQVMVCCSSRIGWAFHWAGLCFAQFWSFFCSAVCLDAVVNSESVACNCTVSVVEGSHPQCHCGQTEISTQKATDYTNYTAFFVTNAS